MLKIAIASFLQHIQSQNTWAQPILQTHAGQSILIDTKLAKAHWLILETGEFTLAGETATPDATISTTPSNLLRLAAKDEKATEGIVITGDTALTTALATVISKLRWDIADDLSHVMGDVASEKLVNGANQVRASVQDTADNLGDMLKEYLVEEAMLLAKPTQIDTFNTAIDTLKADTARLSKRIEQLQNKLL